MSAPATHSQPSRKGKKAWRKNIDIDPVTAGLDAARDQYIQTGGKLLVDADSAQLFQTDTTGDANIRDEARRSGRRLLKADEIIAARSKVPALDTHIRPGEKTLVTDGVIEGGLKRKRGEKISYRELDRLRKLAADRAQGHRDVVQVSEQASHDPWSAPLPEPEDPHRSFLDKPQPIREPKTKQRAPETLLADGKAVPNLRKPNPGRSYNPAFDDWTSLLEREGEKEVDAEKRRLALAAEQAERDEAAARMAAQVETEDAEALSEYESEWEGFASEAELGDDVLKAKRPQRKTPQERKKVDRRKKQEALDKHERKTKERERQEQQVEAIIRAAKERKARGGDKDWEGLDSDASGDDGGDEVFTKRPRFGKRFAAPDKPLELVLPDELQDSLRKLRPEGNLLKDRFRNYILQGKVESRRAAMPRKAKNRKATELWSYKDWKLPSHA